jgi:polysaccharide export outer membrane protein
MLTRWLAPLAAVMLMAGCVATPPAPLELQPTVVKSLQQYTREYVLQPGDQIEVSVFQVPELSKASIVRPDGYVSLPVLKDVKVVGMGVPALNDYLKNAYSGRLVNPDVTVAVVNPRAAFVAVMGEVPRPGAVPIREAPTVAMALAASGGVTRTAGLDGVAVIRLTEDGHLTGYVVERKNAGEIAFYMAMSNFSLQAGDIIVVPESGRSQFVRFIQDYVNAPLTGFNQLAQPYFQYRIVELVH